MTDLYIGKIVMVNDRGQQRRGKLLAHEVPHGLRRTGCWRVELEGGAVLGFHESEFAPYRPKSEVE